MRFCEEKMARIVETGAELVVTSNPGCAIQIEEGARRFGPAIAVLRPVSVLHRAYFGDS